MLVPWRNDGAGGTYPTDSCARRGRAAPRAPLRELSNFRFTMEGVLHNMLAAEGFWNKMYQGVAQCTS